MNLQEAKVEAALASRLMSKPTYIVANSKDKDDFFISFSDDDKTKAETWYTHGCEKGEGYRPPVSNRDEQPKKRKRTAEEIIEDLGKEKPAKVKSAKVKAPTELKIVEFKTTEEAASKAVESCKAKIGGKLWVVSIKGSWAIQKSIIDQCEAGLILVIKDQGFYVYPKSMWNEFESIFKSSTYEAGKPYSQSVLPKKFDKYFKATSKKASK